MDSDEWLGYLFGALIWEKLEDWGKDIWERCIGYIYQGGYGVWRSLYCILIPENIHHNQVDRIQQLIDAYTAYVLSHWQMSNLTATETNTEPPIWYNPLRRWTSHVQSTSTLDSFYTAKTSDLYWLEQTIILSTGYLYCFQDLNQYHYTKIYRVLIYQHGIPQNNKQNQRKHFKEKVVQSWTHGHGFHWSCYILCYPETTSLVGWWNVQMRHQLG